ncbi:MAG: hypothetical protein AB2A00_15220 [Myxococcota bacterium]
MRLRRALPLLLLATAAAWACTRADLFGVQSDPSLPDKITLSGTVCSDNPLEQRFPVKVVFLIDTSNWAPTATNSLINGFRSQALSDVFNLYSGANEVSFAVVAYNGETISFTSDEFTRDLGVLQNAAQRTGLPCNSTDQARCQERRYELALERAENLITGDLLVSDRGLRARTRYVIVLYAEGPRIGPGAVSRPDAGPAGPPPQPETLYCTPVCDADEDPGRACRPEAHCDQGCHFEREVRRMREFVVDNGAADLAVHTAQFFTSPPPDPNAGPCCGTDAPEDTCQAQTVLQRMAAAGGGSYLAFQSPGELSFRQLEYNATRNTFVMKNLVAVNLNARATPDGLKPDSDADGLTDDEERALGTQPLRVDSDDDGIGDRLEHVLRSVGLDPLRADAPTTCTGLEKNHDRDGDGLNDCEEVLLGTDSTLFDSDADGFPDRVEFLGGTNYLDNDVSGDVDQDGTRNGEELKQHTDARSNDAKTRGELSYLYRVISQGIGKLMDIQRPRAVSGVTVKSVSPRVYAGISVLQFNRADTTLSWRDYNDQQQGPAVKVDRDGEYTLHSATSKPDSELENRSITVRVISQLLPPRDLLETLQVRETERECVDWRVRNITLVHTSPRSEQDRLAGNLQGAATTEGFNRILIYYAESPVSSPLGPGLFRVAPVDMVFIPPRHKAPDVAELNVADGDFVLLGERTEAP